MTDEYTEMAAGPDCAAAPDNSKQTIGWREWVSLPGLGIEQLKAKVDTGARTSALHAFSVKEFVNADGETCVRFGVHPDQRTLEREIFCEAPVLDKRVVRDSGGHAQERFVIGIQMHIGPHIIPIELTLTDRDDMLFRMLIGRTAMAGNFTVDPSRSYLIGKKRRKKIKKKLSKSNRA